MSKQAFIWGLFKTEEVASAKAEKILVPEKLEIPKNLIVEQASCGGLFTVILAREKETNNTVVLTAGVGKGGRLGLGSEENQSKLTPIPKKFFNNDVLTQVKAGAWHCCAMGSSGDVYYWGTMSKFMVSMTPTRVKGFDAQNPAKKISSGHQFAAVINDKGELFTFGSNTSFKCGFESPSEIEIPKQVIICQNQQQVAFTDVGCGIEFCIACSTDGELWAWGDNSNLQLGIGKTAKRLNHLPTKVITPVYKGVPVRFAQVSCNKGEKHGHTLAVTDTGLVYAFGDNYKYKLGITKPKKSKQEKENSHKSDEHGEPTLLQYFEEKQIPISKVDCGGIHSMAMTTSGDLYSWGCGSDGRLGHPEAAGHRYLYKEKLPRLVESLKGKVVDFSCWYYNNVAIANK